MNTYYKILQDLHLSPIRYKALLRPAILGAALFLGPVVTLTTAGNAVDKASTAYASWQIDSVIADKIAPYRVTGKSYKTDDFIDVRTAEIFADSPVDAKYEEKINSIKSLANYSLAALRGTAKTEGLTDDASKRVEQALFEFERDMQAVKGMHNAGAHLAKIREKIKAQGLSQYREESALRIIDNAGEEISRISAGIIDENASANIDGAIKHAEVEIERIIESEKLATVKTKYAEAYDEYQQLHRMTEQNNWTIKRNKLNTSPTEIDVSGLISPRALNSENEELAFDRLNAVTAQYQTAIKKFEAFVEEHNAKVAKARAAQKPAQKTAQKPTQKPSQQQASRPAASSKQPVQKEAPAESVEPEKPTIQGLIGGLFKKR